MMALPKSLVKVLALPFLALLLSSCAKDTNFNMTPNDSAWEAVDDATTETGDEQLEAIDSKDGLDEELAALNQTGTWDNIAAEDKESCPDTIDFDLPVVLNNKVQMYLDIFQNQQRKQFSRWLARSARYRPMVEKALEEAGLPKDLFYLAMIESGYSQLACSRAKAVGLWQFMKATGKQYNLHVNKYVDERRNAIKSTRAAANYLSDLHQEFDDWYLAIAAYNCGPGTIRSGLRKHHVDNFWDLAGTSHLSLETKRYVPKLIAALLIAKNPEKYGFTDIDYEEPLRYDTITVGPGMSLDAIALICNSTTKQIKLLNQELRLGKTPLNTDKYTVKIPEATAAIAMKNISRLHSVVSTGYKTYKVGRGDTLAKICSHYKINKTTLLRVNKLHGSSLVYGRNLRIPYSTIIYRLIPEGSKAMAAYQDSLVLHKIKRGDTVLKIAKKYNVPPEMIVAWNGLKNSHSIRAGQQLSLYIDNSDVKRDKNSDASLALLTADKKKAKLNGPDSPYEWYNVQDGDSLWTISRKYSASTAEIKRLNNLTSDMIHPGSVLKVKKV